MILISGTAVGLSLIAWSLHRCWQQRRREAVEVISRESRVTLLERLEGEEQAAGKKPVAVATTDPQADDAGQTTPSLTLPVTTATLRQGEGNEGQAGAVAMKVSNVATEERGMEDVPAPQQVGEDEATLFVIGAEMYELKAAAEELPPVQIVRRIVRRRMAEQLLLWPDADEPLAGAAQPSVSATMER